MQFKEGVGWKAAYNDEKGLYGAEVVFQGSWELFEISGSVFNSLSNAMPCSDAEELIKTGRRLYSHVNDRCGPPYTIVLDEAYADYCPWMQADDPAGKTWSAEMTDAAVELFESEKANREQRRKRRQKNGE